MGGKRSNFIYYSLFMQRIHLNIHIILNYFSQGFFDWMSNISSKYLIQRYWIDSFQIKHNNKPKDRMIPIPTKLIYYTFLLWYIYFFLYLLLLVKCIHDIILKNRKLYCFLKQCLSNFCLCFICAVSLINNYITIIGCQYILINDVHIRYCL